jgi:ribose 5-phosphate isomerase A
MEKHNMAKTVKNENSPKDWIEKAKKNAAREAAKLVEDGFVIGLGSGSTVAYAMEKIGARIKCEELRVEGVPTSYQALELAVKHGIPITTLDEHPVLDLTIDGADQIDDKLNLIKGMGGALLREKVVASASKKLVIVADETKKVKTLGEKNHPVPIEVLPFAAPIAMQKIRENGGKPCIRKGINKVGPLITDNGNFIIDAVFGVIHQPVKLEGYLKSLAGVVEAGIFVQMAHLVYLGKRSGVQELLR